MSTTIRALTHDEKSHIDQLLARLREHFRVWPTEYGKDWYLVNFVYYEGCGRRDNYCAEILRECAPLALGQTLVSDHGFAWCMIGSTDSWRIAVKHAEIAEPIDLFRLDESPLLHPDHHDGDTGPFEPGEGAHESIYAILGQIGQTVTY